MLITDFSVDLIRESFRGCFCFKWREMPSLHLIFEYDYPLLLSIQSYKRWQDFAHSFCMVSVKTWRLLWLGFIHASVDADVKLCLPPLIRTQSVCTRNYMLLLQSAVMVQLPPGRTKLKGWPVYYVGAGIRCIDPCYRVFHGNWHEKIDITHRWKVLEKN